MQKILIGTMVFLTVIMMGILVMDTEPRYLQKIYEFQNEIPVGINIITKKSVNNPKPIFDATLYRNKNKVNKKIFTPMTILYQQELLVGRKHNIIDKDKLISIAQKLPKSSVPYILDIECWYLYTPNDLKAEKNIDKYILVIDTMKKARPDLKFGYYGVVVQGGYWPLMNKNPDSLRRWNLVNNRLKRIIPYVDVICPGLYTYYDDIEGWKKNALVYINFIKQYNKPIYPFIWPQFHDRNKNLRSQYMSAQFWTAQLNLINREADGVIIWGGYLQDWDDNAPWWQITKQFILGE